MDNSELNPSIQEEELDELQQEYITFFNIGEVENQKCVSLKNKYRCSYEIPNKTYGTSQSKQQDELDMSQFVLKAMYGKYSGERL